MTKKIDYKKWHLGPPPSVGWWPASVYEVRNPRMLGWFDGKYWSSFLSDTNNEETAAIVAKSRGGSQKVEWQHRPASWPARSRT